MVDDEPVHVDGAAGHEHLAVGALRTSGGSCRSGELGPVLLTQGGMPKISDSRAKQILCLEALTPDDQRR